MSVTLGQIIVRGLTADITLRPGQYSDRSVVGETYLQRLWDSILAVKIAVMGRRCSSFSVLD